MHRIIPERDFLGKVSVILCAQGYPRIVNVRGLCRHRSQDSRSSSQYHECTFLIDSYYGNTSRCYLYYIAYKTWNSDNQNARSYINKQKEKLRILGIKEKIAGVTRKQLKSCETSYTCKYTSGHLIPNSVYTSQLFSCFFVSLLFYSLISNQA